MTEVRNRELYNEALIHFNEPCIMHGQLARLIGYEENMWDNYFFYRLKNGKKQYTSCVGGYTWLTVLKGQGLVWPRHPSY